MAIVTLRRELQPGDELQLTVQTADAPHLRAFVPENLESAGGVLSLYHDANHDSELVIPVREG